MDVLKRLNVTQGQIADFCRRNHIHRLAFFGSVLRDDFASHSDVDVLYEFESDHHIGWDVVLIKEELEALLGHPVDLVPFKYINHRLKDRILSQAQDQYVAA